MLALERRRRRRSLRLLGWCLLRWSGLGLLAVLLNASALVRHFSFRSKKHHRQSAAPDAIIPFAAIGPTSSPHIRAGNVKIKPNAKGSTAKQFTDDLGRVVDHWHDAGVVESGRTDDAENPDDLARRVVVGRDDRRRAGQRKQLIFRADKNAHALGVLGAAK